MLVYWLSILHNKPLNSGVTKEIIVTVIVRLLFTLPRGNHFRPASTEGSLGHAHRTHS